MKIKVKKEDIPKQRNSEFLSARMRKSGAHEKTHKAKRRKEKMKMKAADLGGYFICKISCGTIITIE